MTARDFCFIVFRMTGVLFMLIATFLVPKGILTLTEGASYMSLPLRTIILNIIVFVFPAVIGWYLWVSAYSLTDRLFRGMSTPVDSETADGSNAVRDDAHSDVATKGDGEFAVIEYEDAKLRVKDIHAAVISVAGILILASAIPELITMTWEIIFATDSESPVSLFDQVKSNSRLMDLGVWPPMIVRLALGLWLFLGSEGVVRFLNKLRGRTPA